MNEEIFLKIRAIIANQFLADPESITPVTSAIDVDGWDSVSHTMLILEIEERLGILLPSEDVGSLETVADLAALVERRMRE
ncbi:acyl carrier protein [Nitrospirillum sp. BR 11164]|uniref:acyl carrier protein n=1 Tax=Nitrospirillum sp. BR 11164 TaxID=3104324 RepID=UPI002B001914|nr:acyl carrier protein [Nitrospirillum sp. BR 11164]MEA1649030.1 acyl carrier protein [Nitrospirillum sp. BR 11164]